MVPDGPDRFDSRHLHSDHAFDLQRCGFEESNPAPATSVVMQFFRVFSAHGGRGRRSPWVVPPSVPEINSC